MSRHPDWATRLDAYTLASLATPFSYNAAVGLNCCTFVFGAIQAMTGLEIGRRFEGRYISKREAFRTMREYCGESSLEPFVRALMLEHGFPLRPWTYAQRGDAVLSPNGPGDHFFGILGLNGKDVLSIGEAGVRRVPISIRCKTWSV